MGHYILGEPRPEIIGLKLRCASRKRRPTETWYETECAFRLYDKFGLIDAHQKHNVRGIITNDGEVPFSYTPKPRKKSA